MVVRREGPLSPVSVIGITPESQNPRSVAKSATRPGRQTNILFRETVGLGDGPDRDRVVDVDATGVEGLAVECKQRRVFYLCLKNFDGRGRRETLGLFEQGAHDQDIGDFGRTEFVGDLGGGDADDLGLGSGKI
jgi:hypothetical protein